MSKIEEIQKYIAQFDDEDDAEYDLQLLLSMREGKFEPGKLTLEILGCYKELVNSREVLSDWDYPEEDGLEILIDRITSA